MGLQHPRKMSNKKNYEVTKTRTFNNWWYYKNKIETMESLARGRKISAIVTTLNRNIYIKKNREAVQRFRPKTEKISQLDLRNVKVKVK